MADNSIQTKRIISIEKGHEYQPKSNDKIGNAEVFFMMSTIKQSI